MDSGMSQFMWNATEHKISDMDVFKEHMAVLERTVKEVEEFGVKQDVHKAIEYFYARCDRKGGLNLFLYGLREKRPDCLIEGLLLIKKHLGITT